MASAQVGKTEIINNIVGYFVDQDPSPMLMVLPTLEIADAWSKDRLAPMIRDTPCLTGKVKDVKTRNSGNTIRHKTFPGGHITLAGANSPSSLSSRPVRLALKDEVDRYPKSAGTEGSPGKLADKRTANFWNRKHVEMSTPTIKGESAIEESYENSDKRKYWVPCPKCRAFQILMFKQVRWPSPSGEGKWKAEKHEPEKAVYLCAECGAELTDSDKLVMVAKGEWRAEAPFAGIAGFWINALYSPWVTFTSFVSEFLAAKRAGPLQQQVFANTMFGETWEMHGSQGLDENIFYNRREVYTVPASVAVLTAGVDVQEDRIEIEVKGWGRGEESWGLAHSIFYGATTDPNGGAWKSLDDYLATTWAHPSGSPLRIAAVGVDTGYRTKEAYAWIRPRQARRVFALKGAKDRGKPLVGRPRRSGVKMVRLFEVGTDTAKTTLYGNLRLQEPGPGYLHFPMTYDRQYFEQLTAEKQVTTYRKGFRLIEWVKEPGRRNEALDLNVYALAALAILNPRLDKLAADLAAHAIEAKDAPPEPDEPDGLEGALPPQKPKPKRPRKGGWLNRWRGGE